MSSRLCPYCMQVSDNDTCPHCGKNIDYTGKPMHLPAGYVVSGSHPYVLGAALGQGGFGITYIALDTVTNTRVAIKEYYPTYCSARSSHSVVTAYDSQEDVYAKGKERFLKEAGTLKSLEALENIVNVVDFFEANNSAYLVMEFLEGSSLKEYASQNGVFPAQQFLRQLEPLMEDIQRMHEQGVIHRDIAPDNIILMPDGKMKLIDFGAARSYLGSKSMTMVVKKGFAPVEQYFSTGSTASTDVYALAATIYYCITGKVPTDSAERQYDEVPLVSPMALGAEITEKQEQALLKALNIQPRDRIQTVREFLEEIQAEPLPVPVVIPVPEEAAEPEAAPEMEAAPEAEAAPEEAVPEAEVAPEEDAVPVPAAVPEEEAATEAEETTDAEEAAEEEAIPVPTAIPEIDAEPAPEAAPEVKPAPVTRKKRPVILAAVAILVLVAAIFLFSGKDASQEDAVSSQATEEGAATMLPVSNSGETEALEAVQTEPITTEPTYDEDDFEGPIAVSMPVSNAPSADPGGSGGGGGSGGSGGGGGGGGFWPFFPGLFG